MNPRGEQKASGATNEVGAPDSGFWSIGLVLTPRDKDLFPVLGPVVTARRVEPTATVAFVKTWSRTQWTVAARLTTDHAQFACAAPSLV